MAISTYLADVWSATAFDDPELAGYAESRIRRDTRLGIQTMAGLSLVMQLCIAVLILILGINTLYLHTSVIFGLLSLHVLVSAVYIGEVRALQVLGMVFLIMGALAITLLAHRVGDLNIGMMAAVVMLFAAIPLVPWALREAITVITLTYLLLTSSLVVVPGRFAPESLWVLQLLVLGAAIIAVTLASRNTFIRKQDLRARYDLESAHGDMELLSMQDYLTGAWNRRYLSEKFSEFRQQCLEQNQAMHVAILDIDNFKGINDQFGHQFGDKILMSVADIFVRLLGNRGRLIRLGGDEFQIIYCGDGLDSLIEAAIVELQQTLADASLKPGQSITLSAGIATSEPGQVANLEELYRSADHALYGEKHNRPDANEATHTLARTGSWQL